MARLHRRNFLPAFSFSFILWSLWAAIFILLDPKTTLIISKTEVSIVLVLFFIVTFMAIFITSSLLFANTRRGLFLATFVTLALFLRLEKLGYWYNLLFLFAFFLSLEIFISKKKKEKIV